jgi:hypothetical protein
MIKANELRIGNLVLYKGEERKITIQTFEDIGQGERDEEDFDPIPLIEEQLVKFGLEQDEEEENVFNTKDYSGLYLKKGLQWYLKRRAKDGDHVVKAGVKYVHQLQNLIYDLEDKELCQSTSL